jgi:DNA ligase-1
MAKRQFVMLAQKYEPRKHYIGNYFVSIKLDGIRCIWDGGLSRGLYCDEVPWANVEKDYRLLDRPRASGLWSRLGKVIHAPSWFLDQLPNYPLDGELWTPGGSWQVLSSIVKQHNPNDVNWRQVYYSIFDSPSLEQIFASGDINITNFKKSFRNIESWIEERRKTVSLNPITGEISFMFMYEKLLLRYEINNVYGIHEQIELPYKDYGEILENKLKEVVDSGSEGLILRAPHSVWVPERSHLLLKYKPFQDDEGIVTGYIWGRKTDLGSKLLGMMGALILNYNGKRLELSGFTDQERRMVSRSNSSEEAYKEGEKHPGEEVNQGFVNPSFPRGSKITFRYRELSDTGIPKEARFLRKPI